MLFTIWAGKYKKLYAFHYLGQKKIKNSILFAHPRQNVRKVLSFWHFFALGVARGRGRGTKWGMGQEKGQKHETFRTFGPKCAKSLEFLTLSGGQAGLSTPRGRKRTPAGARQISKTQCFSLFVGGGPQKSSFYLGKRDFLKILSFSGRLATPI